MEGVAHLLLQAYTLLAATLLITTANFSHPTAAYDPNPLQDLCVAGIWLAVYVNGKFCKDPRKVSPNDFFYTGLNVPRRTSNRLGVNVTLLTADSIPGLNTMGLSLGRVDLAANGGLNPPHHHPRASEIFYLIKGTLYVGFITANPTHRLFAKILTAGDVFVFPLGLIHFQWNIGSRQAVGFAILNSQNPGVVTTANTLFGAVPAVLSDVLAKAFQLDVATVEYLQQLPWQNP
ncbi:unnamed protein product [Linum tenue]|uniref:Germin-like protein n=2 Tax=Linum tenue TaxID=586396 RepID=A0AAV0LH02_9ROSI|nr:unnamed protein product [Linum tenue]